MMKLLYLQLNNPLRIGVVGSVDLHVYIMLLGTNVYGTIQNIMRVKPFPVS